MWIVVWLFSRSFLSYILLLGKVISRGTTNKTPLFFNLPSLHQIRYSKIRILIAVSQRHWFEFDFLFCRFFWNSPLEHPLEQRRPHCPNLASVICPRDPALENLRPIEQIPFLGTATSALLVGSLWYMCSLHRDVAY